MNTQSDSPVSLPVSFPPDPFEFDKASPYLASELSAMDSRSQSKATPTLSMIVDRHLTFPPSQ